MKRRKQSPDGTTMPNETRKQLWGFCESCHCQQIAVCEDCKKLLRETVNEDGAALNRDNDSLDTWVEIRSEADFPKEDGYYLATVGSVGIDPSETTCHELNWFKGKWYLPSDEMIEMYPVIAWMPKPKPHTKQPDASTEGHRESA